MNSATETSQGWSGIYSGLVITWEWIERLFTALWTGLGWPHAVLVMFCIGVYYFKQEVKGVIPRIKRIGADGFEVEPQNIPVQPSVKSAEPRSTPTGEFPHAHGIMLEIVRKQFEKENSPDAVDLIMQDDAGWRVLWYFENVYSYIFGGQIKLLELLNQRGAVGAPLDEIQREWEAHKELHKPQLDQLDMDGYIKFLLAKDLILKTDVDLKITPTGKEFLMWMTKFGRSSDRLW